MVIFVHYEPSPLKHVFPTPPLRSVTSACCQNFNLTFMAMVFEFVEYERKVLFHVPKKEEKRFLQALMVDEMRNITVQGYDDEDDMIDSTSKRRKLDMPVLSALYNTSHYHTYENSFSADPLMEKDKQLSVEEAGHVVEKYAPVFMESVMVMGGYWFYLSGYSVFVHQKSVDDLADKSKYGHQKLAVAFIRRKTQKEADSFECTLRIGNMELMAVSGLYGKCVDQGNGYTAFLGSAFQFEDTTLTESVETICTRVITSLKVYQMLIKDIELSSVFQKGLDQEMGVCSSKSPK